MKKLLVLIPLMLILLLASCAPDIVRNGGVVEHGTPLPTADLEQAYSDESIVYITKTGTKYHREGCSHLSNSKIPISLEQAKQHCLEPCSACEPPT